jgi:predicted ATPase/signal transduction histidine kinase
MGFAGEHDLTEAHRGPRHLVLRQARAQAGALIVKTIAPGHPATAALAAGLRREHELLARLSVPGAARPMGMSEVEGQPALLLVDAGPLNLKQWLRRRPLAADRFLALAVQLAETLARLHERHLVHRDLNPTNIVVGDGDRLTVIDFDAATIVDGPGVPARLAGALPYLAPEETGRMNRLVDARADLYALGATFYEMLTGAPPISSADPLEAVHAQLTWSPVPPARTNAALPSVLSDITVKLLAKMPERRYQSAEALLADLRQAQQRLRGDSIAGFELGLVDLARALPLAQHLYGREQPLASLRAAWERAAAGARAVVVIEGPAGVGKSALAAELRNVVEERGVWLQGKFDAQETSVPFAPLAEALRGPIQALVDGPEEPRRQARERLEPALAGNGRVVADVVPELERLLGPQPPVPALGPVETDNRFQLTFQLFLRALATPERPLALLIDDLQWADPASMKLLQGLAAAPDLPNLLLLGTRRPTERAAELAGAEVIALAPLELEEVLALCCDTLRCSPERGRPLAELVTRKTAGNPFFVRSLLRHLHQSEAFRFDPALGAWSWDLERVRSVAVSENVADLLLVGLRRLPGHAQEVLQCAAALGNRVSLGLLATACGHDLPATAGALWSAAAEGLLLPIEGPGGPAAPETAFHFAHDRIQQAAYALLDEPRRLAAHLEMGRRLLREASDAPSDEQLYLVVSQLNRGADLITEPGERLAVAALNRRAAARARQTSAFGQALACARRGIALLPAGAWQDHHALAFELHRQALECAHVMGFGELTEELLAAGLAGTSDRAEQAELYAIDVAAKSARLHGEEALRRGLEGLRMFGLEISADPAALAEELAAVERNLQGRRPDQLLDAPPMTDREELACMRLLTQVMVPAYAVRQEQWAFLVARMVNLCLVGGNAPSSPLAYSSYAAFRQRLTGDYRASHAWGRMALELSRRLDDPLVECAVSAMFASIINPWCEPLRASVALAQQWGPRGLAVGELLYGAASYTTALILRQHQGVELSRLFAEAEATLLVAKRTNQRIEIDAMLLIRQSIRCLQGLTSARNSFDDAEFDEAAYLQMAESRMRLAHHCVLRLQSSYLLGDLARARALVDDGGRTMPFVRAFVLAVEFTFYGALTLSAWCAQAPPGERAELVAAITARRDQLQTWADNCPESYRHKQRLVDAELARVAGETERAAELYDEGIAAAARGGFLQDEALGNELAGRLYRARGRKRIGDMYLSEAVDRYARWGAHAKAQALHEEFPDRAPVTARPGDLSALDVVSLARAAEVIASELGPERLLEKLLEVCLASAGAERGALVLEEGDRLFLRAAGRVSEPVSLARTPLEEASSLVPVALLRRVYASNEPVVIGDASQPGPGGFDEPSFAARTVLSVVAVPLRRQGRRVGVLYLENNLCAQVFTPDRVQVLQLLSSQIATSLQISRLFEGLTHEIDERSRAEEAVRFLGNASVALAATLDYPATLAVVARLAVGKLADWCVVDAFEGGEARRVAAAHLDPAKEKLLRELRERQDRTGAPLQALEMRASMRPILVPESNDTDMRRYLHDPDSVRLAREIGVGSSMILPLRANERLLGTMTLVCSPGGRRYDERDLALGEELARRAAMALDNARLYREAREAIRVRDDFLSIASHELNTPIAALQLSVEGLDQAGQSPSPAAAERLVSLITRQSRRLGTLVRELLSVAELQAGRLRVERSTVDLSRVVREIVEELGPELARARCGLTVEAPAPVEGLWDRTRLDQVVSNLLSNAMKYGAGQPIRIAVSASAGIARLVVEDHGIGIDPERLRHVFGRFERAVPASNYGGLGLGLYVVREIVAALGGTVSVESAIGAGSTFTVELPRATTS